MVHSLEDLVKDQAVVQVTLMARRVCKSQMDFLYPRESLDPIVYNSLRQEPIHEWKSSSTSTSERNQRLVVVAGKSPTQHLEDIVPMTLVGRIRKPKFPIFPWYYYGQDVSSMLVQKGRALVLSSGLLHVDLPLYPTLHKSTNMKHIKSDAKYIQSLSELEYKAIQTRQGLWSSDSVRELKPELIQEVEFQSKASPWKKLWRRIKETIHVS